MKARYPLGSETTAHIRTGTLLGQRVLALESAGGGLLSPHSVIPISRTSSPYSLTTAVSELTSNTAGTDTTKVNQSLDTLSATLNQISPQLGPAFDGLSRFSQSLNSRNEGLAELLRTAGDVTQILSQRSQQVNVLILNANDLVAVLNEHRQAISGLLAHISAVSRQLSGLVADNEHDLAPTLDKLNSITQMLEKNRDNIAKALPGLAKFELTQGEIIANGAYYNALVPNLFPPGQFLQPLLDYFFGFRRGTDAGRPPDNAGPRAEFPFPSMAFRSQEIFHHDGKKKTLAISLAVAQGAILCAGAAFLVRETFFGPTTITAYFSAATAIYPGDAVRVVGRQGRDDRLDQPGRHADETDTQSRSRRAHSRRRQGSDRGSKPDRGSLRAACPGLPSRPRVTHACWRGNPQRPDRGPRGVGRGQSPTDASCNRFGAGRRSTSRRTRDLHFQVHRQRFERPGRERRQASTDARSAIRCGKDFRRRQREHRRHRQKLQTFVTALRDSKNQIVLFQNRLASVASVVNGSRSDLDAALRELSVAVVDVQRFVEGNRNQLSEQIRGLASVTQNLVDHRKALENVLHVTPNAIANYRKHLQPFIRRCDGGSLHRPTSRTRCGTSAA